MIKVYQIALTDAEIAAVNNGETSDRIKAYFDRSFDRTFKAENIQYYDYVANVHGTNDLEEAFMYMNVWNESKVERLGPCSSMSVGDILEMEDGSKFRCASFGFDQI